MIYDLDGLKRNLLRQLQSFYELSKAEMEQLDQFIPEALERASWSFQHISNKYYSVPAKSHEGCEVRFNYLHQCQYAQFLYFLSNTIWRKTEDEPLCDKIYGLNKTMSACDLFYQIELPSIFYFDHPVGSAMGRARYSDYFSFSQGCTVGNNHGIFPVLESHVFLASNAKVIGKSHIGSHVLISANAYVKDEDIPDNSIVFGQSPNLIIKTDRRAEVDDFAANIFR